MRATIILGILGVSFALISGAQAREMSEIEQQGYDKGWDAANDFCQGLRTGHGGWGHMEVTDEFERACKKGFNKYINSNASCQKRMEEQKSYSEMSDARSDACT